MAFETVAVRTVLDVRGLPAKGIPGKCPVRRIGPVLVRYMPARVLRVVIGLGGITLAVKLGLSAYG